MAINSAATAGNLIWQEGATTIQLTDGVKSSLVPYLPMGNQW